MAFERDGAERFGAAALPVLDALETLLGPVPRERAGVRLHGLAGLARLLASDGPAGNVAAQAIGATARPVRALLFDKNNMMNWALGWHQDRTIAVDARHDVTGYGPWTVKQGIVHVAPPFGLLASMVTLRIHLDSVDEDNAPLLIAPASHRRLVPEAAIEQTVATCGAVPCMARRGDIWAYATPILHASEAARRPRRRRVLQVDYAATDLPTPLRWAGI